MHEGACTYSVSRSLGEPPTFAGVNLGKVQMFLAKGTPTPSSEAGAAYFLVGDADQLHEFHCANGIEIAQAIDDRPYGIRDYTVRDPLWVLPRVWTSLVQHRSARQN